MALNRSKTTAAPALATLFFVFIPACQFHPRGYYCVRRSALVPLPSPALRPARPNPTVMEVGLGTETLVWAEPSTTEKGQNLGIYLPRQQISWFMLLSPHPAVSFGFSGEAGLADGAVPMGSGLLQSPGVSPWGLGVSLRVRLTIRRILTLEWGCDMWGYAIPDRVAYIKPANTCSDVQTPLSQWPQNGTRITAEFIGRTYGAMGIRLGWSHLTFAVGVRNHLYNVGVRYERVEDESDIGPALTYVPYPYFQIGWEIRITDWLQVMVGAYQPLASNPVSYAPIIGIGLRLTDMAFGTNRRGKSRRRPKATPVARPVTQPRPTPVPRKPVQPEKRAEPDDPDDL